MILASPQTKPKQTINNVLAQVADALAEVYRLANQTDDRELHIAAVQIAEAGRRLRRYQRAAEGAR